MRYLVVGEEDWKRSFSGEASRLIDSPSMDTDRSASRLTESSSGPKAPTKETDVNIVRFQINTPVEVALASPGGKLIQGRYGDRVLFHLTDGRIMYVPPVVATMIEKQAIAPQEYFELCKTEHKNDRRRSIEWGLKRIDPEPQKDGVESAPSDPESPLEHDLRVSTEIANARKAANKEPRAITAISDDAIPPFAPMANGNGAAVAAMKDGNSQPLPSTKLEHALKTAISAAYNAEKYGTELGYVVRFDADAIKSMAITVLINMSEGGRR